MYFLIIVMPCFIFHSNSTFTYHGHSIWSAINLCLFHTFEQILDRSLSNTHLFVDFFNSGIPLMSADASN